MEIIETKVKDEMLKIKVIKEIKKTKKGVRFAQWHTYMDLIPDGETTKRTKWVQVKFTREVPVTDVEKIGSGYIYCLSSNVNAPQDFYIIKEDDEGNKVYPTVWIHKVEKYEPYRSVVSQSSFNDNAPHHVETETKETNETTIDEDYEKYYK